MSKGTAKSGTRSRRKPAKQLKGQVRRVDGGENATTVQLTLPIKELLAGVSGAIESLAGEAGLLIMKSLIDEEVEQLAGQRCKHDQGDKAVRWGAEESYVLLGGKKVPVRRPRVRERRGSELPIERFRLFQRPALMEGSVAKEVICGVSMRDYERAVDGLCDGYGIQRSSVSRHWKAVSAARLAEFLERPLRELDLVAVLIDGIEFHEQLLVVAMGIDSQGKKEILGLWQGATENSEVCRGLLDDLVRRGVDSQKKLLFVLDGSKALQKAVRQVFGKDSLIQRCQVHKARNILEHLPPSRHRSIRMRLRAAWGMKSYEEAKSELVRLVRHLKDLNPSAARSLEEGLEETLTLHQLDVPDALRRSLKTTNPIESCFSATRKYCRNVKRWRKGDMAMRWAGTMLLEAQKRFRRLKGHRAMPKLLLTLGRSIESQKALA